MHLLSSIKRFHLCFFPILSFIILSIPSLSILAANCESYQNKLNSIRAQQRAGYSAQKGNKLKERENKAHKKWWDCKSGKLKDKSKKSSNKTKDKNKKSSTPLSKSAGRNSRNYKLNKAPKNGFSSQAIVTKQKYHGNQQKRWLMFYRKPKGCTRPKTMKEFTRCIEDKNNQQLQFEQQEGQ
jgi:hypothetical protein